MASETCNGLRPQLASLSRWLSPPPRAPEAELLGFGDGGDEALAALELDHGRVVLLVERQVVDALAAGAGDVALDPRVVVERELLLDADVELPGKLTGPLR